MYLCVKSSLKAMTDGVKWRIFQLIKWNRWENFIFSSGALH